MTRFSYTLSVAMTMLASLSFGQTPYLPGELDDLYKQDKIKSTFDINADLNPFYLRGDFDGDKKIDYAIAVIEHKTGKKGIVIFHTASKKFFVIGAGKEISAKYGDDYGWMNAWEVYDKSEPELGVGEVKKIQLRSEAILIRKLEASSGLIYWDGKKYQWYQQGD